MKKILLNRGDSEQSDMSIEEVARKLQENLGVGDAWQRSFLSRQHPRDRQTWDLRNIKDTLPIQRYVQRLRETGLDIGKGKAEFGFHMPLPNKNDSQRILEIFRRRNDSLRILQIFRRRLVMAIPEVFEKSSEEED